MSALLLAGAVAAWLLLLCAAVGAYEGARTLKRREFWRVIMAALVGLGASWRGRPPARDAGWDYLEVDEHEGGER